MSFAGFNMDVTESSDDKRARLVFKWAFTQREKDRELTYTTLYERARTMTEQELQEGITNANK